MSRITHTSQIPTDTPQWILGLLTSLFEQPNQAHCLNVLRAAHISFLNLGSIIYCHQQNLLFIFKEKNLYAYDQIYTIPPCL